MSALNKMLQDSRNRNMTKLELVILSVHNDGRPHEAEDAAAELAALRAERDALREALEDAADMLHSAQYINYPTYYTTYEGAEKNARAPLEK